MPTIRRRVLGGLVWAATPLLALITWLCQHVPDDGADAWADRIGALLRGARQADVLGRAATVLGPARFARLSLASFWQAHLRYVGRTFIESFRVGAFSRAQLSERFELEGEAHVRHALTQGRGILLLMPHLGHIGAVTIALGARGYDITVAGNGMDITIGTDTVPLRYLERRVAALFAHGGVRRVTLATRLPFHAAEIFRRNALLALFVDFTVTQRHNERFPFAAADLVANVGPAVLALRNKPALLYASARPVDGRPGHHRVSVRPVPFAPTGHIRADAHALTAIAVGLAADDLLERPEQWWSWDWAQVHASEPADETVEAVPEVVAL